MQRTRVEDIQSQYLQVPGCYTVDGGTFVLIIQ
jgi:hypothetical protein